MLKFAALALDYDGTAGGALSSKTPTSVGGSLLSNWNARANHEGVLWKI
jgi:hypothetical protein